MTRDDEAHPAREPELVLDPVLPLPAARDYVAADGTDVRLLAACRAGGVTHHTLPPGHVSRPIARRTVEVLWYVLAGCGELWRAYGGSERVDGVSCGDSVRIAPRVSFQVRALERLEVLVITMPPWPGADEDVPATESAPWTPA